MKSNIIDRRKFLITASFGTAAAGLVPTMVMGSNSFPVSGGNGPDSPEGLQTLFFQPSLLKNTEKKYWAWSHSITVQDNRLVMAVPVNPMEYEGARVMGLSISVSDDGVHWRELDPFACPQPDALAGFSWRYFEDEFIYYPSCIPQGPDRDEYHREVRQFRSSDLKNWTFMGDEYTTRREKQWYKSRWAELDILEDDGIYYGYITSEPRPELAKDSLGMLRSSDGRRWEVLPPPVIEWGDLPSQQMEVSFCAKTGGRYYLVMGTRCYMGQLGYSLVTFVGDSPTGPFYPDREAFMLISSSSRDINWLAKVFHWKGELLAGNWTTPGLDESLMGGNHNLASSGRSLWIGPMKKLITDDAGHLRMAWWKGNEAAKGEKLNIPLEKVKLVHPTGQYIEKNKGFSAGPSGNMELSAGHDGMLAMLPGKFDFNTGLIMEGSFRAMEQRGHIGSHWHSAAAGFFFEETPGQGMLARMETLGMNRIGKFEYQPEPTYDADEYARVSYKNTRRTGEYYGLSRFTAEDVTGPLGFATPCGILNDKIHHFRLLVKNGIFELYLDDLLVKTYRTGDTSGRIGMFAWNGKVEFMDLRFNIMN